LQTSVFALSQDKEKGKNCLRQICAGSLTRALRLFWDMRLLHILSLLFSKCKGKEAQKIAFARFKAYP
jgi:hypothetical protein